MIDLTSRDDIAVLTLSHGKANTMDLELCEALTARLAECRRAAAPALVVTGAGRIFSAGVDLVRLVKDGPAYARAFVPALTTMLRTAFEYERPMVAAVNGAAIAGGCILACAADRRLAAEGAGLGVPEQLVGVPFPPTLFEIVRYTAAPHRLQQLAMSGAVVSSAQAVDAGLADEIVPLDALLDRATEAARALAAIPPHVFMATKRQLRAPAFERIARITPEAEAAVVDTWAHPDTIAIIDRYVARTFKRGSV